MTYRDRVIADGAVAYWRLGETSGTTAVDVIAGANGTIATGVTLNQGGAIADGDKAMAFNAGASPTQRITVPMGAYGAVGTGPLSIELWFKCGLVAYSHILDSGASQDLRGWNIFPNPVNGYIGLRFCDGITASFLVVFDNVPAAAYADNTWHHLVAVVTRDATDTVIPYLDGVGYPARPLPQAGRNFTPAAPLLLGAYEGGAASVGSLDDVAIYKTALSATQVAAHYAAATPTYRSRVIRDGASAYWRLDETSGATAVDTIGANNGTIAGGVTLAQPGALSDGDKAMTFNGTTGKIAAPNGPYLAFGTGPATVEWWMRTPVNQTNVWPIEFRDGLTHPGISFLLDLSAVQFAVGIPTADTYCGFGFPYADNAWHHIVGVVTRGATDLLALYIDGIKRNEAPLPLAGQTLTSTFAAVIGAYRGTSGFFTGLIDEVAVYPVALSAARIAEHYAAASTKYSAYSSRVLADGAVAYWRLDEVTGLTAVDSVGTAHGTISGGVTLNQVGPLADKNTAMLFDGPAAGRVTVPNGSYAAFGTGPLSIEMWFRKSVPAVFNFPLSLQQGSGKGVQFTADAGGMYFVVVPVTGAQVQPGAATADTKWHHAVGVIRRGAPDVAELYLDGVLRGSVPLTVAGTDFSVPVSNFVIGGHNVDPTVSLHFSGGVDEVAIYKTALTATQVGAHYALSQYAETSYPGRVLADGASNYWRLGEKSGPTAADSISAANGTITGGVTLGQAGALADGNTAMQFNGTSGYVTVPDAPSLNPTTVVTIEAWVKADANGVSGVRSLVVKGRSAVAFAYGVLAAAGKVGFRWSGGDHYTTVAQLVVGVWKHIVVVADEAGTPTVKVYVDGVLYAGAFNVALPSGDFITTNTFPLQIANVENAGTDYFPGTIDEVAIYPLALTPTQIAAHYAARTFSVSIGGVPAWLLGDDFMASRYNVWRPITPSDTVDLATLTDGLLIGVAGDVAAVMQNGQAVVFSLPAGAWVPIAARRINATGTTATGIVALYER